MPREIDPMVRDWAVWLVREHRSIPRRGPRRSSPTIRAMLAGVARGSRISSTPPSYLRPRQAVGSPVRSLITTRALGSQDL